MSFNKLFAFNLRSILVCTYVLFIAGCGGGSSQDNPAPVNPATSRELAQICAKESPYAAKSSMPSKIGDLTDEKKWIKAYMSERYLWYKDIPKVNEKILGTTCCRMAS